MIKQIKDIIAINKPPFHGLRYDLVEFKDYYTIRLYRDNFDVLPSTHRLAFSEWISEVIKIARLSDIRLYLEVFDHAYEPGIHSK